MNKYYIVQYVGKESMTCKTQEDYKKLIEDIISINNDKENDFLIGNVIKSINYDNSIEAIFESYIKLSDSLSLEEIDYKTTQFNNEEELINLISNKVVLNEKNNKNNSLLQIATFKPKEYKSIYGIESFDIGLHTDEIFYKNDKRFLNEKIVKEHIKEFSNDGVEGFSFFMNLALQFKEYGPLLDSKVDTISLLNEEKRFKQFLKLLGDVAIEYYSSSLSKDYENKRKVASLIKNMSYLNVLTFDKKFNNSKKKLLDK